MNQPKVIPRKFRTNNQTVAKISSHNFVTNSRVIPICNYVHVHFINEFKIYMWLNQPTVILRRFEPTTKLWPEKQIFWPAFYRMLGFMDLTKRWIWTAYLGLLFFCFAELLLHLFCPVEGIFFVHFHGQHLLLDGVHDCCVVGVPLAPNLHTYKNTHFV